MPLGTNSLTTTTGAKFIPQLWSKDVLMFVKAALVLEPLVRHYDTEVTESGGSLHIPNVSTITANTMTQGSQVTLNAPTETDTLLTINSWKEASFTVPDILAAQSKYDLRSAYTQAAGYAIALQIDGDIATAMVAGFTTNTAVGTYGTAISDAVVLSAVLALDLAKVPMDGRYFVVTAKGKGDLLNIDKYVRYDAQGLSTDANPIKTGKIGEIYGMEVYFTQTPNLVTAGTPTQNNSLMFHKEAFAIAIQKQPRTQAQYKQEYLSWLVTTDVLYGMTVLRNAFGIVVKS